MIALGEQVVRQEHGSPKISIFQFPLGSVRLILRIIPEVPNDNINGISHPHIDRNVYELFTLYIYILWYPGQSYMNIV